MKSRFLKATVCTVCALLALTLCCAAFAFKATHTMFLGDVNMDNNVNTGDAVLILRYTISMANLDRVQMILADANVDETVNTGDATYVLRMTVGLDVPVQVEIEINEPEEGEILFDGSSISTTCEGIVISGSTATITKAGSYKISGNLADGQLIVDTESEEDVELTLNNMSVSCSNSAPFYVKNAENVKLILEAGTENTFTDASEYTFAEGEDEPKACIFSADDLTIKGEGTLIINGNYNNGIMSKDDLKIKGGTLVINAVSHGLRGNDSVTIEDAANVTIISQKDGIQTDNTEDEDKGFVEIGENSVVVINASDDGIQADRVVRISDSSVTLTAGAKGIKSALDVAISNSTLNITSTEDAINANGCVAVVDSSATIETDGDGIQSDDSLLISGSSDIKIIRAGAKGLNVTVLCEIIDGARLEVVASGEDGINSNGNVRIATADIKITSAYDGIQADLEFIMSAGRVEINSGSAVASEEDSGKCIKAGTVLAITGGETILVTNTNDGIHSDGTIEISGGTHNVVAGLDGIDAAGELTINAGITVDAGRAVDQADESGKGIKSDMSVSILGGSINLTTVEDSIHSNAAITISGGSFTIVSSTDAIQAETNLTISAGTFDITCGGGASGANTSLSTKGLKGITTVTISGGTFTINTKDDCIHSDGTIYIDGGNFTMSTSDDGVHADEYLYIRGGEMVITRSYEGIESKNIVASAGSVTLTSTDDGINCADSNETSGGGPGGHGGPGGSGTATLNISGSAYLWVNANGDGVDVNGSITMSGGTLIVNGPTNNGNGILDYDRTFTLTGGYLFGIGSSGMLQVPTSSSQCVLRMSFTSNQNTNSLIHLQNAEGDSLFTYSPIKQYRVIIFSAPTLTRSTSYSVYSGGSSTGTLQNGMYTGGTYSGGTLRKTFTTGTSYAVTVSI